MNDSSIRIVRTIFIWLLVAMPIPGKAQDEGGFREPDQQGPFRVSLERVVDGWRYDLRWQEGPRSRSRGRFHLGDVHTASSTSTSQSCERAVGIATRDFVRGYLRGKRLRVRNVREGRQPRSRVGQLEADGEDISSVLLEMGLAIPYNDSRRNADLRRWDCSKNDDARAALEAAGIDVPADAG
jgi:endonuclease YncB( thermonuclease family)